MGKKVVLLVGGWGAEREVSLEKGKHVEAALKEAGYDLKVIEVTKDIQKLMDDLTPKPDVVFNNIYGRIGEDGILQGFLEMLEIPYTHSGVMASAIAMDKVMSKRLAESVGVPVAGGGLATKEEVAAESTVARPYVVKPYNEGSSVDIHILHEGDNHLDSIVQNWNYGSHALVEEYIPGKELTVAVLDGKAQAVTEIVSYTGGFFDYEAKYQDARTELVLPAKIPQDVYEAALDYAVRVYNVIGCHGLARCDFRYDDSKGIKGLCFLEINNQPGLTADSIGPSQCVHNGMSFTQLCSHLVETAQCHGLVNSKQDIKDAQVSSKETAYQQSA
ncbi:MAG: D-alanine--D-alanine ligase [Alphaproteobacteria bacterium]|nr:D-alanine--D-alanine ligase [Alphaproteobacteria bacterium]